MHCVSFPTYEPMPPIDWTHKHYQTDGLLVSQKGVTIKLKLFYVAVQAFFSALFDHLHLNWEKWRSGSHTKYLRPLHNHAHNTHTKRIFTHIHTHNTHTHRIFTHIHTHKTHTQRMLKHIHTHNTHTQRMLTHIHTHNTHTQRILTHIHSHNTHTKRILTHIHTHNTHTQWILTHIHTHKTHTQRMLTHTLTPAEHIIFTQPLRSGRIWHKVNF